MRVVLERIFSGFDWDAAKERSNIRKHGIGFDEAVVALSQPHVEQISIQQGEVRREAICPSFGRLITIIYVVRDDKCRIISARAARSDEKDQYRDRFAGRGT